MKGEPVRAILDGFQFGSHLGDFLRESVVPLFIEVAETLTGFSVDFKLREALSENIGFVHSHGVNPCRDR